jgi:hypothetical protein
MDVADWQHAGMPCWQLRMKKHLATCVQKSDEQCH